MINVQNIDDNECFKWCLVRNLQPEDHNSVRIRKVDKIRAVFGANYFQKTGGHPESEASKLGHKIFKTTK